MKTKSLVLCDKAIREYSQQVGIFQLKDTQDPLLFRFHDSRKSGSYYLIKRIQGKSRWVRLGSYPEISTTTARKALAIAIKRMTLLAQQGEFGEVSFCANNSIADILNWYLSRHLANPHLSKDSQKGVKSVIEHHLIPAIGNLSLTQVSRQVLDQQLFWPLQQRLKPSTVKQIFQILKRAFKTAFGVGLIQENPMVAISFKDLVTSKVRVKAARLTVIDLPKLFLQIQQASSTTQLLVFLMLLFGTRVGETSQAKWLDFDRRSNLWRIPAGNTKTGQAHRLPMTQLVWQLLRHYKQSLPVKLQRSPWLFPTRSNVKKAISPQYASQIVSLLAKGHWSAHDLRKLARTAWLELDIDYVIGEFLLNHQLRQVDKAYIQTFADVKCQQAINTWHQYLFINGLREFEFGRSLLDSQRMLTG